MQSLILFRHGKAENRAPSGDDFDRDLVERGREEARATAQALAEAGLIPDLAVVSAAARTLATWETARLVWPACRADIRANLYNADARALLSAGRSPLGRTVVIIAHNPGVQVGAMALFHQAGEPNLERQAREGFPTSAAAAFAFDGETVTSLGLFGADR
jgi:phosphohistidine phosphatase